MSSITGGELPLQNPKGGAAPQQPPTPGSAVAAPVKAPREVAVRDFSMLIALLAISAFFAVMSPSFLGARNLSLLAIELSITAVLALGMLLVLLPGHIDLSAGSSLAFFGGIGAVLIFDHGWPAPVAMGAAFLAGLLVYWLMAVASGTRPYGRAYEILSSGFFKLVYAGLLVAFCYHLVAGIRHLIWDTGRLLERAQSKRSAGIVVAVSIALSHAQEGAVNPAAIVKIKLIRLINDGLRCNGSSKVFPPLSCAADNTGLYCRGKIFFNILFL
jgi:succinate dehydrogenase cytochrome b556 subunit